MVADKAFQTRMQRIQVLVQQVEQTADPPLKATALELMQLLMELHGAGLERLLEITAESRASSLALIDEVARDELVASLLLLYGLHPRDLESRVRAALEKVQPSLLAHGGTIELLSVAEGVIRLKLAGSCNGCSSSSEMIRQTIEQAIYDAAPDAAALEIEGAILAKPKAATASANGFVQLEGLPARS